jgi:hypothetical protein
LFDLGTEKRLDVRSLLHLLDTTQNSQVSNLRGLREVHARPDWGTPSRLEIGDTAGWKPALPSGVLRHTMCVLDYQAWPIPVGLKIRLAA